MVKTILKQVIITLRDMVITAISFTIIISLFSYFWLKNKTIDAILTQLNSQLFYFTLAIGLAMVVYLHISKKWREKISWYFPPFVIILIALYFIYSSYDKTFWNNAPFDVNAFGIGVSTASLGFALLFAYRALKSKEGNMKDIQKKLDKKIKELTDATKKTERTLGECNKLVDEYNKLKNEEDLKVKELQK